MITTTLPDGAVEAKHETDVTIGQTTTIRGTVSIPGSGTQRLVGETIQKSSESITTLAITNPAGQTYHDRIVVTRGGPLSQSETNTTRGPDGLVSIARSVTSITLNPAAVAQGSVPESLSIPAAGSTSVGPAADIEAQVLGTPVAASDVAPAPLPAALPKLSTLTFLGTVLGAAALRRGCRWFTNPMNIK